MRSLLLVGGLLALCSTPLAAQYAIQAPHVQGEVGATVSVAVTANLALPVRGFSLGLTHDASVASLVSISQGAACLATNGGAGADFTFVDLNPAHGPGGIFGVVVSMSAPIEDIPAGTGLEVAVFEYQVVGAPGALGALSFSDALGDPTVVTVFSVAGVSHHPSTTSGSIAVTPPPVQALDCQLTDACACLATIGWVQPVAYDSVRVLVDGVVAATVPAGPVQLTIPSGSLVDICVIGTLNGLDSAESCCTLQCLPVPATQPPQDLMCSVDGACSALLSWTNPEAYGEIRVLLDGALAATLAGNATSTQLLVGPGNHVLCLQVDGSCGTPSVEACCQADCTSAEPSFVRGDCNVDAAFNIADPISILSYLFPGVGGPPVLACQDACDCNDDGMLNIADAICQLSGLFGNPTVPPPSPYPGCGVDPGADALPSCSYAHCP